MNLAQRFCMVRPGDRAPAAHPAPTPDAPHTPIRTPDWIVPQNRSDAERDFDRILFAAPTRRMADKTQVFPLERNAIIRTRLTHSHEVANLARSIGTHIVYNTGLFADVPHARRDIPALLAAVGLAHDIGNPPFGHSGETAIQTWVKAHAKDLFGDKEGRKLNAAQQQDFLQFEGNAQTYRIVNKLHVTYDRHGMNLTFATLAALMKYSVPSDKVDGKTCARKKFGFFQSEADIAARMWAATGLKEGLRHPLVYIMEACDDIAYSILDAEDCVQKEIVSPADLLDWLDKRRADDPTIGWLVDAGRQERDRLYALSLPPRDLNDVLMQKVRMHMFNAMVSAVIMAFEEHFDAIAKGTLAQPLLAVSKVDGLCRALKDFEAEYAYRHRSVLELQLQGLETIHRLMDIFWVGIRERERGAAVSPHGDYAYSRISRNFRKWFEDPQNPMPLRYRQLQLLTDMVSGMADSYAVDLRAELERYVRP